jgi:hypothetical protein
MISPLMERIVKAIEARESFDFTPYVEAEV